MQGAIAVLRIFWGLVYFSNGLAKVVPGLGHVPGGFFLIDSEGARGILAHEVHNHPVTLYHDLVFNVILPNWSFFGPLVGLTEMTAGVLLILGLAAPVGALLAALLALHLWFATMFNGPWLFEYPIEWVTLLCLAAMRPGRFWGLDATVWRSPRLRAVFA
jgi:uncharacterized membrane protein YphA (DoxX/SURF4 family)